MRRDAGIAFLIPILFSVGSNTLAAGQTTGQDAAWEYARQIESTIAKGDPTFLNQALDMDSVRAKAMGGVQGSEEEVKSFTSSDDIALGKTVMSWIETDGSYRLLRVRSGKDGGYVALFRALDKNDILNYYELMLTPDASGAFRVRDVNFYSGAVLLSDSYRDDWLLSLQASRQDFLRTLGDADAAFVRSYREMDTFRDLAKAGKGKDAWKIYETLPGRVQNRLPTLTWGLTAAADLDDKVFDPLVERARRIHGKDPRLDFCLMFAYQKRKDYPRALDALGRLEAALGGDPHLMVRRSNLLLAQKQVAAARVSLQQAIELDRYWSPAYEGLLQISLEEKNYAETARLLTAFETDAEAELNDLTQIRRYAGFVKSKEYKKWVADRAPAVTPAEKGLTDRRCLAFARSLDDALAADDTTFLDRAYDVDKAIDKAVRDLPGPKDTLDGFRVGLKEKESFSHLVALAKAGGFTFLRLRREGSEPRLLYRLTQAQGGFGYLEFALAEDSTGAVRVQDVYLFAAGEWFSDAYRRGWLMALAAVESSDPVGNVQTLKKQAQQVDAANELFVAGKHKAFVEAYSKLPDAVRKEKFMMVKYVAASQKLGPRPYDDAMEAFRSLYPDDPALDVLGIDQLLIDQNWTGLIAAVDRLEKSLGGTDSCLSALRGLALYGKGEKEAGKKLLEKSVVDDPDAVFPRALLKLLSTLDGRKKV